MSFRWRKNELSVPGWQNFTPRNMRCYNDVGSCKITPEARTVARQRSFYSNLKDHSCSIHDLHGNNWRKDVRYMHALLPHKQFRERLFEGVAFHIRLGCNHEWKMTWHGSMAGEEPTIADSKSSTVPNFYWRYPICYQSEVTTVTNDRGLIVESPKAIHTQKPFSFWRVSLVSRKALFFYFKKYLAISINVFLSYVLSERSALICRWLPLTTSIRIVIVPMCT